MSRRRRVAGTVAAVPVVVLLAAAGWVGVRGALAVEHLRTAAAVVPEIRSTLTAGDTAAAGPLLGRFTRDTAAARRLTGDPVWAGATRLPWIGDDLAAVRAVSAAADRVGTGVVTPLAGPQVLGGLTAARRSGGGTPALVAALARAEGPLAGAQRQLSAAAAGLDRVDLTGVDGSVAAPTRQLRDRLGAAAPGLDAAVRASRALPAMVGGDQPRTYLVLFQNLAEARSLGGVPSAFVVVRAQRGTVTLVSQGSSEQVGPFASPVLDLGPGNRQLFEDRPQRYLQDVTATPWFPDAALAAREMWRRTSGQRVDGVVATDPVMLARLMAVTGPIRVGDGETVDARHIVGLVQSEVYRRFPDPSQQDAFFARTAAAAFQSLIRFRGDPLLLVRAAAGAVGEGRLLVWDSRADVEATVTGTVLAGVPGGSAAPGAERPLVGVYLQDGTGSKMSWYLRRSVRVSEGRRSATGERPLTVHLVVSSTAPTSGLPAYVSGAGAYGVRPGSMRVTVLVVGSGAGAVVDARVDGRARPLGAYRLHGRPVGALTLDLTPGSTHTVEVRLVAPPGRGTPRLVLQPMSG